MKNRGDVRDGGVNKTAKLGESRSLSQSEPSPSDVAETTFPSRVPRSTPRTASRLLIRCTRMTGQEIPHVIKLLLCCRCIQVEHCCMTQWLEQYVSAWGAWLDVSVVAGFGNESRISFGRRASGVPMAQELRLQAAGCSSGLNSLATTAGRRMSLLHLPPMRMR